MGGSRQTPPSQEPVTFICVWNGLLLHCGFLHSLSILKLCFNIQSKSHSYTITSWNSIWHSSLKIPAIIFPIMKKYFSHPHLWSSLKKSFFFHFKGNQVILVYARCLPTRTTNNIVTVFWTNQASLSFVMIMTFPGKMLQSPPCFPPVVEMSYFLRDTKHKAAFTRHLCHF